jgi:hypothetical protein
LHIDFKNDVVAQVIDDTVDAVESDKSYEIPVVFTSLYDKKQICARSYRDSGSNLTIVKSNILPNEFIEHLNQNVNIKFMEGGTCMPLVKVCFNVLGKEQSAIVGLAPKSQNMPLNVDV